MLYMTVISDGKVKATGRINIDANEREGNKKCAMTRNFQLETRRVFTEDVKLR